MTAAVHVGPYPLRLPDFWYEKGVVREKPGFFGYNAIATPGVSFDFYVIVGRGRDGAERERLLEAQIKGKDPDRHVHEEAKFQGIAFERHRLEECKGLAPGAVFEIFLCEAYGDLLQFSFGFVSPLEQEESLRMFFTTMVSGAIVDRGYALHGHGTEPEPGGGSSGGVVKPRRSWRDLFRRR